ncbi:MAG: ABC transporter permease subunit [Planctomycetota bacterium]|jgi:ABC-type transport system involved in multi-copper enzyme maturation permease subunit
MLKAIIAKEFLNNILNLRFMIGLILCIIVTIACIMILAHDYQQEMADYNLRVNSQDEFLSNYAHRGRLYWMIRPQKPPERFRPLIVGIPGNVGLESFDDNPLPILFPPLDFLFVVTIIMSLLAILFSYDSITGERQSGTLRLMISNSIPRAKMLLAKWIGGTASLLIPFILSLLVGAIYISLNSNIQWDGSAGAELTLLTAASITFITLFYLLGLMVSTFSQYSAISILNCLFLWVLLILVIPNMCPYISAQLYRIPSIREIERKSHEIEIASLKVYRQIKGEVIKKFKSKYGKLFSEFESMEFGGLGAFGQVELKHREAAQQRATADPEFKAMMDEFRQEVEKAREVIGRIRKESDKLEKDLETKAALQTKLAKNLACISPFANFVYVARDLTGTGLRSLEYFEQTKAEYGKQFWSYVEKKEQEAMEKNPAFGPESLLDVSDRPRFVFKEEALKDKLNAILPYWGILALFNVVFFAAAFVGFLRYDVR